MPCLCWCVPARPSPGTPEPPLAAESSRRDPAAPAAPQLLPVTNTDLALPITAPVIPPSCQPHAQPQGPDGSRPRGEQGIFGCSSRFPWLVPRRHWQALPVLPGPPHGPGMSPPLSGRDVDPPGARARRRVGVCPELPRSPAFPPGAAAPGPRLPSGSALRTGTGAAPPRACPPPERCGTRPAPSGSKQAAARGGGERIGAALPAGPRRSPQSRPRRGAGRAPRAPPALSPGLPVPPARSDPGPAPPPGGGCARGLGAGPAAWAGREPAMPARRGRGF